MMIFPLGHFKRFVCSRIFTSLSLFMNHFLELNCFILSIDFIYNLLWLRLQGRDYYINKGTIITLNAKNSMTIKNDSVQNDYAFKWFDVKR